MLQSNCLAAAFHAALVVAFADPGEIRLEQIMADQCQKPLREHPVRTNDATYRRLQGRVKGRCVGAPGWSL